MKKLCAIGFLMLASLIFMKAVYSQLSPFEKDQEYMSIEAAEKRWGKKPFDAKAFKEGSEEVRASMAADLVRSQTLRGKPMKEIPNILGRHDGFIWSDRIPAYFIFDGADKNRNSWQIVFLPTVGGRVREIRIHKNCCKGFPD